MNKPWNERTPKEQVLGLISDSVSDLLYYDRKECDTFAVGDIQNLIKKGEITVDEIVNEFRKHIENSLRQ